jgi:hypothetical protein
MFYDFSVVCGKNSCMPQSDYIRSMSYESFIRKCRKYTVGDKHGAHRAIMNNLMDFDNGEKDTKYLKHEKTLADIKRWMKSATRAAIKDKDYISIRKQLKTFIPIIESATTSNQLLKICNDGMDLLVQINKAT